MTNMLFYTHSGWRYVVILIAIVAIVRYLIGWLGKKEWTGFDRILSIAYPVSIDIQWLLGLLLYVLAPGAWFHGRGSVNFWEHFVTMTLALAAAHYGSIRARRQAESVDRFRTLAIWFVVASLLVALGVARITGVF
jgi:hypothetical protein